MIVLLIRQQDFPNIPAGSKVKKAYLFWTAAMGLPGNIADRKVTEDRVRQPVKMRMGNKKNMQR